MTKLLIEIYVMAIRIFYTTQIIQILNIQFLICVLDIVIYLHKHLMFRGISFYKYK